MDADPAGADQDAITLLKQDHRAVESLFSDFEKATSDAAKGSLAIDICAALKVHARIEEYLFYPAALSGETAPLLAEARIEHAMAKDLIAQIEASGPNEPMFDAKVRVLAEYVRHHVTEEEEQLFPLCEKSRVDLVALGRELAIRKQELTRGATVSNPIQAIPA
ncbi:MAG: hemerythrin domain-containing protein [Porphyrobacter sp.]|nr:hemerythrin domain-containing protein [Porphyrobacter sp.]